MKVLPCDFYWVYQRNVQPLATMSCCRKQEYRRLCIQFDGTFDPSKHAAYLVAVGWCVAVQEPGLEDGRHAKATTRASQSHADRFVPRQVYLEATRATSLSSSNESENLSALQPYP